MITYRQLCCRCRKAYVLVTWKDRYPVCYNCQKQEMEGEVEGPEMKKLFNIPEEFYKDSKFLRSIKINCIRYGKLTENQIKAFKKAVADMKKEKKKKKE